MLGLELLIAIWLLGLLSVGAYFYSQRCIQLFLGRETDELSYILDTESVPARWCLPHARRIARMQQRGAGERRMERARRRADRRFQKGMRRMQAFAKGAPIFETEGARKGTLDDLKRIQSQWKERIFQHEPY